MQDFFYLKLRTKANKPKQTISSQVSRTIKARKKEPGHLELSDLNE